jgi:hypothetical protein
VVFATRFFDFAIKHILSATSFSNGTTSHSNKAAILNPAPTSSSSIMSSYAMKKRGQKDDPIDAAKIPFMDMLAQFGASTPRTLVSSDSYLSPFSPQRRNSSKDLIEQGPSKAPNALMKLPPLAEDSEGLDTAVEKMRRQRSALQVLRERKAEREKKLKAEQDAVPEEDRQREKQLEDRVAVLEDENARLRFETAVVCGMLREMDGLVEEQKAVVTKMSK